MAKPITDTDAAALVAALTPALQTRDRQAIVGILAELLRGRAKLGKRWHGMADVLYHTGEFDLAEMALSLLIEQTGGPPDVLFTAAAFLANMGRATKAAQLVAAIPSGTLKPGVREHFLATASAELGDTASAQKHFRAALGILPSHGQVWHGFAVGHRFTPGDPMLAALEKLVAATPRETSLEWALLHFALGKALADAGRGDAAFSAFAAGADALARLQPFDIAADVADADATIAAWSAEALASAPAGPPLAQSPIVIGSPRSGTTLVEQILSSHSQIGGGGENDAMRHIVGLVGGIDPAALTSYVRRGGSAADLQTLYVHLLQERFGYDGRLVDKALGSRQLGLIARLFPDAPILWVRRDPLDTAWSIYRTYFADGQDWSWTQAGIARHMAAEDRLYAHWRDLLGSRVMTVAYEALVADPATIIPQILAHCGLAFEPATLTPEHTARTVRTASVAQVRRPINAGAIGSAAPYRRHLQPFIDAYTAAGGTID